MPIYKYRVKKGVESTSEGKIEALTEKEAIEKLNAMGFMPLRLQKEDVPAQKIESAAPQVVGRLKSREITVFSRQLATLFKSGVPILNALSIIMEQSESPALRGIIQDIHDGIKEGETFSSVLTRYPKVFSPLFVAMVRTGENSSALPEVLLGITEYRLKQEEFTSRLRMAMAYPVLMAVVGMGTIIFMFAFCCSPSCADIWGHGAGPSFTYEDFVGHKSWFRPAGGRRLFWFLSFLFLSCAARAKHRRARDCGVRFPCACPSLVNLY